MRKDWESFTLPESHKSALPFNNAFRVDAASIW
jgi:hypothetical protein